MNTSKSIIICALFLALVVLAPVFVSAQAEGSVKPGTFFYLLDTTFEKVGLFLTFNPEKKAKKALEYADKRLTQIEAIDELQDSDTVETLIKNYEGNIALAVQKSKEINDKEKAETLFASIAENTSKNQEVLSAVLVNVPEEAKEAIERAIEVSKKNQEEALRQIAELKKEVSELRAEIQNLKDELKEKEEQKTVTQEPKEENDDDELENLKKEIEKLEKEIKQPEAKLDIQPTTTQSPKTFTLPNGAVVDANGNVIQMAPQLAPQQFLNTIDSVKKHYALKIAEVDKQIIEKKYEQRIAEESRKKYTGQPHPLMNIWINTINYAESDITRLQLEKESLQNELRIKLINLGEF